MEASLPIKYKIYAKKNKLYAVICYKENGVSKRKWLPTGLSVNAKAKERTAVADKLAADFYSKLLCSSNTKNEEETGSSDLSPVSESKTTVSEDTCDTRGTQDRERYEFTSYLSTWFSSAKSNIEINTCKTYKSIIKKITAYFKDKELYIDSMKPIDIQEFYSYLYDQGLKGATIKRYHVVIHKALKCAVKNEMIAANPADNVERPKLKRYEATFYTKDELNKLFEVFKGDRMELVVYIGAYYGLRRCEIIGLKWSAIDFEKKTLSVNGKVISIYENGKEKPVFESELKTVSTVRTLPLIPQIEKMLLEQREKQKYFKKLLGKEFDNSYSDFVCCDNYGKLITPEYVTIHFGHMVKTRGLRHLRFHDLRHSCASLLLANGIPMKAIQDWLGHATFNVTANFYSHLDYSSRIISAETISKVFGEVEGCEGKKIKPNGL